MMMPVMGLQQCTKRTPWTRKPMRPGYTPHTQHVVEVHSYINAPTKHLGHIKFRKMVVVFFAGTPINLQLSCLHNNVVHTGFLMRVSLMGHAPAPARVQGIFHFSCPIDAHTWGRKRGLQRHGAACGAGCAERHCNSAQHLANTTELPAARAGSQPVNRDHPQWVGGGGGGHDTLSNSAGESYSVRW